MKITKEIMEKIEGEARLDFEWSDGRVVDAKVKFFSYRGMEEIITGRSPLDALVLTPRVCGICGHAQLMATVNALENVYKINGIDLKVTNKAKKIREVTLNCEIIQNHIKWLYFVLMPFLYQLEGKEFPKDRSLEALHYASQSTKLIATFAGQWPHNSYAIPGGVVCDPTYVELFQAKELSLKLASFFEKEIVRGDFEDIVNISSFRELMEFDGVIKEIVDILERHHIAEVGKAHDRFMVLGESSLFKRGKAIKTVIKSVSERYIDEEEVDFTFAKNVIYNGRYYEVGPLSRAMLRKNPLIKNMHRLYKDALINRIIAKVMEIAYLTKEVRNLLEDIDINENSYIKPPVKIESLQGKGIGFAEAARGSLFHSVTIKDKKIQRYNIITPTQWNLGNSLEKGQNSTIKEALLGLKDERVVSIVFRSFDECSVCTTH